MATAEDVLDFWFGAPADDAHTAQRQARLWWGKDPGLDDEIRRRFADLRLAAIAGALADWQGAPRGRLALIVLIDQFSRNLFRNDARAFEHDPLARLWAIDGIDAGMDRQVRPIERLFYYLPLQHSELLADQERAVALHEQLLREAPAAAHAEFAGYLDYAHRHRDIIERFGRFPHRNAVLGRASTPEELAFLSQPGSSF